MLKMSSRSRHSRRTLPTHRSAWAFASGARVPVIAPNPLGRVAIVGKEPQNRRIVRNALPTTARTREPLQRPYCTGLRDLAATRLRPRAREATQLHKRRRVQLLVGSGVVWGHFLFAISTLTCQATSWGWRSWRDRPPAHGAVDRGVMRPADAE